MDDLKFEVYFDFAWPYVYNAAVWLDPIVSHYSGDLELQWKNFSLEQINAANGGQGKVWDQTDLTKTRSLLASVAGEAARRQGDDAFNSFF